VFGTVVEQVHQSIRPERPHRAPQHLKIGDIAEEAANRTGELRLPPADRRHLMAAPQ
jgi:hypothetical protein